MKRFFCSTCKKMKRVRKMPVIIRNQYSENPTERIGVCNRHMRTPRSFASDRKVAS